MPVDDPLEAIDKQYEDKKDRIFDKIWQAAAELEPFGVVNALKVLFSKEATTARFEAFIQQLVLEIRRLESEGRLLRNKIESSEFQETIIAGMNETAQTNDLEKIKRFAVVVGSSLDSKNKSKNWDDLATYSKDLAQLGENDITALKILYKHQKDLFLPNESTAIDINRFTERHLNVLNDVDHLGMPRDDFYARCSRLNGFGLAIMISEPNPARIVHNDYCFRITRRGLSLVSMLQNVK